MRSIIPLMHIRNGVPARRSAYDRSFYPLGVIGHSVGMRRSTVVRIHESSRIINGNKRDGRSCGSTSPCVAAFELCFREVLCKRIFFYLPTVMNSTLRGSRTMRSTIWYSAVATVADDEAVICI